MSEEYLVRNCAPTLAGLKTGNLFSCPCSGRAELTRTLGSLNRRLKGKGLRIVPLRISGERALIYLYRPERLRADMDDVRTRQLLRERGYDTGSCSRCVVQLAQRVQEQVEFPHEIGLFLGYPPEDVQGFIDHGAQGSKCTGCWRVYGDEAAARKKFDQYKKCTKVYCAQWKRGKPIERLTVAG